MGRWPRALGALLLVVLLAVGASARDFYDLLHVPRSADEAAIKRAYRKLALKMHPDKVGGGEAEKAAAAARFAEVSHAYEVLTDAEKRRVYDRYGEEGLKSMGDAGGGGARGAGGMADIFSQFFGGGFGGFGGAEEEEAPKGDTVVAELEVSLKDLYLGRHFSVVRDRSVLKPAPGTRECNCRGRVVTKQLGPGMFQQYTRRECERCPAVRFEREAQVLGVTVEPGAPDGHEIALFEEGEPMVDGEPGDLVFRLRTVPHARFARAGDDLRAGVTLTLVEALAGYDRELEHLDGRRVRLAHAGVTRPGEVRRVAGEGMPRFEKAGKGDLFVTYGVAFPKALAPAQAEALRALLAGAEWDDVLPVPPPAPAPAHDEL